MIRLELEWKASKDGRMSLTVSKKSQGEQEFTVLGEMGEIYDETEAR